MRERALNCRIVSSKLVYARVACVLASFSVAAAEMPESHSMDMPTMMRPDRAPASVGFGDMYSMGRWMVSYRYMRMDMDGNRIGSNRISPEAIATANATDSTARYDD